MKELQNSLWVIDSLAYVVVSETIFSLNSLSAISEVRYKLAVSDAIERRMRDVIQNIFKILFNLFL
uniref:Uncharacterized protein n=1 Tax=Lepeophtheirus salmonis TaxID=72036 RepID=A0A0K2VEX8_LEPSM